MYVSKNFSEPCHNQERGEIRLTREIPELCQGFYRSKRLRGPGKNEVRDQGKFPEEKTAHYSTKDFFVKEFHGVRNIVVDDSTLKLKKIGNVV